MARYIDAIELLVALNENKVSFNADINYFIMNAPIADVTEVIHAKWIINSDGYYPYCSNCKEIPEYGVMSKYCPECGARMDKE